MGNKVDKGFNRPPKSYTEDVRKIRKEELGHMTNDKIKLPNVIPSKNPLRKLSAEDVKEYIICNPNFLDDFVAHEVPQETVKTWIRRNIGCFSDDAEDSSSEEEDQKEFESKSFKEMVKERHNKHLDLMVVTRNFLSYPYKYRHDDLSEVLERPVPESVPKGIESHLFVHTDVQANDICKIFIYMSRQLFGKYAFPMPQLAYFLSTLRANYMSVEYHNYTHALSHVQSMYWILRKNPGLFTELEMKAMMIASISHDAGHPGLNQSYLKAVGHGMASVYDSPVLEFRHTQTCFLILADLSCNVFCNLPTEDYSRVLHEIQHCILATCFESYKQQSDQLEHLAEMNFDINNEKERAALKAVLMMVCDLASSWKSWECHKVTVWSLYKEFFKQGDKELKFGFDTIPQMMRPNADEIPKYQASFLQGLVLPIFNLVARILPNIKIIVDATVENLDLWKTYVKNK